MRLSIRWKVALGSLLAVTCGLAVAGLLAMQSLEQQTISQLNEMLDARSNLVEYSLRSTFLNPPAPDQQTHLGIIVRQLGDRALARVTVVTCPRSNAWTGAGAPPVSLFYASGVAVAVGTDSLASCPDLNMFSELATLRRLGELENYARAGRLPPEEQIWDCAR